MTIIINDIIATLKKLKLLIDVKHLNADKKLTDQQFDSLDLINFYFQLEEDFNIKIPEEDIEKLDTINHIITYIEVKQKQ